MSTSHIGQQWIERFKTQGEGYRFTVGLPFLRKFLRSPFVQLPVRYACLQPGQRVLEAGCASGKFSVCFAMLGAHVTALDFSATMVENARYLQQTIVSPTKPLTMSFVQGDLEALGLGADTFDLVMNEGVVEHWLDHAGRRHVLQQMARVTKPGGTVAIIVPNGSHPHVTYWIENSPAFLSAPPMIRYTPTLLREDMAYAGLTDLWVDGIYAWRTIDQWPTHRVRQLVGGALQRLIPLPHRVRLVWGIHLIALGRKPFALP